MNVPKVRIMEQIKFMVRNASGIVLICSLFCWGYMELFVKPLVKNENRCIKEMLIENSFMLRHIVPVEVQEKARKELEAYRRLQND